jgi:Flp pilus assembly secretin CpaC
VAAGQSVLVRLARPAERVAIADPDVADVVLVGPREILINGRGRRHTAQSGETVIQEAQTSLIVWDREGRADVRDLYVNRSRTEQVELRVTVAEVNRSAMEAAGFDFRLFQNKIFVAGTPSKLATVNQFTGSLTSPNPDVPKTIQDTLSIVSDRVTFSVLDLDDNFLAFIELLQRESLAKVLARPSLLTRSGEAAHFRSGGEVPIPLVTNDQLAVQFKEFGAIVDFTPTFAPDGSVDLRVTAELSEPDRTISEVNVGGFVVPGFKSRQATTRVRLRDGQSLLIAGLLRDDETEDEQKVPYLGDLPWLGAFFRSTHYSRLRTELLILVQPHVVTADRDDTGMPLPTRRGPLTRDEVRTRGTPNAVTRPRLLGPGEPPPGPEP